jgi:hypothetical protein
MLEVIRRPLNHLTGRRLGRITPPAAAASLLCLPGMYNVQDCYFDYGRADESVRIDIHELLADPCIVSHTTTGYIERYPGAANQVLVAAGQDGSNGAIDDVERTTSRPDRDEPIG